MCIYIYIYIFPSACQLIRDYCTEFKSSPSQTICQITLMSVKKHLYWFHYDTVLSIFDPLV